MALGYKYKKNQVFITSGRIAKKEITPTLESWEKIHAAFPDEIPKPYTLELVRQ